MKVDAFRADQQLVDHNWRFSSPTANSQLTARSERDTATPRSQEEAGRGTRRGRATSAVLLDKLYWFTAKWPLFS